MQFSIPSIADRSFWDSLTSRPSAGPLVRQIREKLSEIPARAPMPTASDYLAARRHNDRDVVDRHWQQDRSTFSRLAAVRLLEGHGDDDRLLNWVFDLLFEPSWTVSAHLPKYDLPRASTPTLDLASCEMACEFAELREVMLPWLQSQSGTLDHSIIDEIDRRTLIPLLRETPWWANPQEPVINNWSGVCGGSLLTACLSLEAQGFARPQARRKLIDVMHLFWNRAFTPTAECDEGPAYWSYGVAYGCMPMMRMTRQQIEAEFDVSRIRAVAQYPERVHIHNGYFLATNDSVSRVGAPLWYMPWLAEFADSPFLRWWIAKYPRFHARSINTLLRDLWGVTQPQPQSPGAPPVIPARYLPDQQIAIFQRPSSGPLFTFAIGGGHNAESHNHNDLGAFQLILDDVPWILDIGQPHYKTDFFGPQRYVKYISASSAGHCCPAINGHEQRVGHDAAGIIVCEEFQAGRLALDLASAYPREAGLSKWHRQAFVPPGAPEARVTDLFQLAADGVFTHRLWFRERPTVNGTTITCGPVVVQLSGAPDRVQVHEFEAQDPHMLLREFPAGHKLYRVDMDYRGPAGRDREITTTLRLA